MRYLYLLLLISVALSLGQDALADTLTLKNGDHLTGTISAVDSQQVTLKTDAAGEIKIKWSAIQQMSSDKPLYVATSDKKTVSGTVSFDGADFIVHTATAGDVRIPPAQITIIRSEDQQQAYEKSLHPRLIDNWTGRIDLGFALARGNSNTTNLNTAIAGDRKTLSGEIKLSASYLYSTSGTSTTGAPGGVTANEVLGFAAYNRDIVGRLFAFASGDFTHDALQDLNLRAIYTGGLGWHVINRPATTFDALLGVNYTRETYGSSATATTPGASVTRNLPGITAGENFVHKFGASTTLTQTFKFYPDLSDINQYRFSLDAALVTKINQWLGWRTSLSDRYVTNPPIAGTQSNDVILSTGLSFSFPH